MVLIKWNLYGLLHITKHGTLSDYWSTQLYIVYSHGHTSQVVNGDHTFFLCYFLAFRFSPRLSLSHNREIYRLPYCQWQQFSKVSQPLPPKLLMDKKSQVIKSVPQTYPTWNSFEKWDEREQGTKALNVLINTPEELCYCWPCHFSIFTCWGRGRKALTFVISICILWRLVFVNAIKALTSSI